MQTLAFEACRQPIVIGRAELLDGVRGQVVLVPAGLVGELQLRPVVGDGHGAGDGTVSPAAGEDQGVVGGAAAGGGD